MPNRLNGANIHVDSAEVEATASQLNASMVDMLNPVRDRCNAAVTEMLNGHMRLPASTPALNDKYAEFTTLLNSLIENVGTFALQFRQMKDNLLEQDERSADFIRNGQ
ncbi:hypothetical protein RM844_15395 [Streptomyces sp. DSM 44915]|uniref:Uncharacterized protein n=1 Tax=Streptomyces chisholmiae TaxID=3075540 RepID=A0ABU2JRR0_9ACTN|nr:hypothetical protein [Streptomyces sp. DSM 44915]MDT0267671.1 hypothetical protein [Streptomyces sp. DSM 44915]